MSHGALTSLKSPAAAHVLPLAVFMLLNAVPPALGVKNPDLPWWRHAPEQWVYPLQTLLVGGLLAWGWKHYVFRPFRGFGLAVLLGVVGIVVWCLPAWAYLRVTEGGGTVPGWLEWFGIAEREDGFDPTIFEGEPVWYAASVGMRFIRLVVVVPLIEEIFWRGFLMRYVVADGGDFRRVPFGTHRWLSFMVVTAGVVLAHHSLDYFGAFIWGVLMYWLAVWTRSLAACVLMHAVGNLLLGLYVMFTRQWGFW